jgi:hypothetical protein
MRPTLEQLLTKLQHQPLDRSLDGVVGDVGRRRAEVVATNTATWRLRAVAMVLVAMGGAAASVSTAAVAASPSGSPFEAWSNLAPSALLEPAG